MTTVRDLSLAMVMVKALNCWIFVSNKDEQAYLNKAKVIQPSIHSQYEDTHIVVLLRLLKSNHTHVSFSILNATLDTVKTINRPGRMTLC